MELKDERICKILSIDGDDRGWRGDLERLIDAAHPAIESKTHSHPKG